jgi:hypothetical protein
MKALRTKFVPIIVVMFLVAVDVVPALADQIGPNLTTPIAVWKRRRPPTVALMPEDKQSAVRALVDEYSTAGRRRC